MQSATRSATELVGQLAHTEEIKDAIRDSGGILALMRQLKQDTPTEGVLEVVTRAITMLTINNKTNQDYIRYTESQNLASVHAPSVSCALNSFRLCPIVAVQTNGEMPMLMQYKSPRPAGFMRHKWSF